MTTIRLYTQSVNPFTTKVELGLALKGLAYQRVSSDDPDDLKRWSPVTQRLPVIEIDGRRTADSAAILSQIEERFPEPPLLAADPKTARAQEQLAQWSDTSFLWYWDRWRAARFPRPGDEQPASDPSLLAKLRDGIARAFSEAGRVMSRAQLREAEVLNGVAARLDDLGAFLGDRPFFYADEPSLADISAYGMLRILDDGPMTGAADLIAARPDLVDYMKRMQARTRDGLAKPDLELPKG